jgi:BirA family biotin operon repressor/biotin-[acetyl-CoA-carboxylase] ligase
MFKITTNELIKLDAIDSKWIYEELSKSKVLENFTVVTAENQTKGKGRWVLFGIQSG